MPLVPAYIDRLQPYEPGRSIEQIKREYGVTDVIKLASNENPFGASPLAVDAIRNHLDDLYRYPADYSTRLREELARRFSVKVDNVVVGSGSDGIMANIIRTFLCDDDEVLTTEAAFAGFERLAHSRGVAYRTVPYTPDWRYDLRALANAINEYTKIIYLANPNNPTGTAFTTAEFDEFYRHVPERVLIIYDEAYQEYVAGEPDFPDSMQYRYDNVITLRTFSKAYGLAGLRVGYGFAHDRLISSLLKVKLPFEPSSLGAAAAIAALDDKEFLDYTIRTNREQRELVTAAFRDSGLNVVPSRANFVMVVFDSADEAAHVNQRLLQQGVIVRPLKSFGLPRCLRISIGTPAENIRCVAALRQAVLQPA